MTGLKLVASFLVASLFLGSIALVPQLLVRLGPIWVLGAAVLLLGGWAWMCLSDEKKARG